MALALTFVDSWEPAAREACLKVLASLQAQPGLELPEGSVNLKLVDEAAISALNEQYTGNAYSTDVLTFNYREAGETPEGELADIAICSQVAERQAQEVSISLAEEIAVLALHGLLHVLGHDHQTAEDQTRLQQLQDDILDRAELPKQEMTWTH